MNPNKIREIEVNELMKQCGVFWAFSKEQFESNRTPLQEGEKYVEIGAGGFMPKSNVDTYIKGMKEIKDRFKKAMKDQKARTSHILYELNNHEAFYTGDVTDTLDALGEDFTHEEVLTVYKTYKAKKYVQN